MVCGFGCCKQDIKCNKNKGLTMSVDEKKIRQDVLDIYVRMVKLISRYDVDKIKESTHIWEDLAFFKEVREGMSRALNKYLSEYSAKRISRSEAGKFDTIKDAADLVLKHIKLVKSES